MDMQLANFEAKKREEKKKRVDAILIDSWSESLSKDSNVSVNRSPKGNMWSAIPVALLCMIANWSMRK